MREYRVQWATVARRDLLDIVGYIAEDNPQTARRIADKIDRAAKTLRRFPLRGRRVPELREHSEDEIRETIIAPWRVMYWVDAEVVTIIAVVDGRRDLHEWLPRRILLFAQDMP